VRSSSYPQDEPKQHEKDDERCPLFPRLPRETVRKVSVGSKSEPYESIKRGEKGSILPLCNQPNVRRDVTQLLLG